MRGIIPSLLLVTAVVGCDGSGPAAQSDAATADVEPTPDASPDQCAPQQGRTCHQGSAYWVDSCGQREGLAETCGPDTSCKDGLCCAPAQTTGPLQLPAHTIHVKWTFAQAGLEKVAFKLRVANDPGEQVGLYLGLFNGTIDKTLFYFGIQTDVARPGVGGVGRGVIFSRWSTQDPADARAAPGGFTEIGTHEGYFVGVRLLYPWKAADYTVTLARTTQDGNADWYELSITDSQGATTSVGSLRFRRSDPATPAAIGNSGTTFTEVYSHATDIGDVPAWETALMSEGNGAPPTDATASYPAWPYAEFPNADAHFDATDGLVHLTFGGSTERCHAAGPLLE